MKFKNITKFKLGILIFSILYIIIFGILYMQRENYEFLMYVSTLIFFILLIGGLNSKYNLSNEVLIGMSLWGLLHMAGGYFVIGNDVLYGYWLLPFLRYDMFVHCFGFGFATLLSFYILKPFLKIKNKLPFTILILIILIGMGLGSLNEIIEFIAVLTIKNTGVGGYDNTLFDMIFNTLGAIIAIVYIKTKIYKVK